MADYFIGKDGTQLGPFKPTEIQKLLDDDEISHSDLCWTQGMDDWLPISEVLQPSHPVPPPLPPARISEKSIDTKSKKKIQPNLDTNAKIVSDNRVCTSCEQKYSYGWRCKECHARYCDACVKGGRSTTTGKGVRLLAGIYTLGMSEVARSTYRNVVKSCPKCGSKDLMRI